MSTDGPTLRDESSEFGMHPAFEPVMKKFRTRKWAKTFRDPQSFFGPHLFTLPRNMPELTSRVQLNTSFYLTNYVAFSLLITAFAILTQPMILVFILLIAAMWMHVLKNKVIRVHTVALQGSNKFIAAAVVSVLVIFFTAGNMIFMVVGICASLVSLHAVMHIAPSDADLDKSHRDSDTNDDEVAMENNV